MDASIASSLLMSMVYHRDQCRLPFFHLGTLGPRTRVFYFGAGVHTVRMGQMKL
jgi:hypothetical protein